MHAYTHIYTYTHTCTTCSERVTDVYVGVKTHLCNVNTRPCTSARNTCFKVHVTLTAGHAHTRPCIYACTCMHMHMGAYARPRHHLTRWGVTTRTLHLCMRVHMHTHAYACARTRAPAHAYMHVHAHMHVCAYVCIHVHKHVDVHMHACKHTWNNNTTTTGWGADADSRSFAHLPRSIQSTTFSILNARTSLYPLPEAPIPFNPPSSLPNIPQDSSRTTASVVLLPNIDSSPECTPRVASLRALTTLVKLRAALQWPLA